VLGGIDGIAFVHLSEADVVRHRIVRDIVSAYDRYAAAQVGITIPESANTAGPSVSGQAGPSAHAS
jgi:hypothetical protein